MAYEELLTTMQRCKTHYLKDPGLLSANQIAMVAMKYQQDIDCWLEYFHDMPLVCIELNRLSKPIGSYTNV